MCESYTSVLSCTELKTASLGEHSAVPLIEDSILKHDRLVSEQNPLSVKFLFTEQKSDAS